MKRKSTHRYIMRLVAVLMAFISLTTVAGIVPVPAIKVSGNARTIANGALFGRATDGTDFGLNVALVNTQVAHTFTITNIGGGTLTLTGNPLVVVGGYEPDQFKVTVQPQASLAASASTTFTVAFNPTQPGFHMAEISIASNDASNSPFTFAVSGEGADVGVTQQTIQFPAPSVLYYPSQSFLPLMARSSSGVAVTYSVVSGPATLAGSTLQLTGTGTVVVQAAQPGGFAGSSTYAPAKTVSVTITVKPDPAGLTLVNLNQVYDASPKAVTAIKNTGLVTITYKVGASFVATPPTNVGSYPVKAVDSATTKTGTLVIAKAPIYVIPFNRRKFAGQPNPAMAVSFTGLQGSDPPSVVKGTMTAKTTATAASPGGTYPITCSGGTATNYFFVYQQGSLVVESFAGTYEGLLVDGPSPPIGKLSLVVNNAATSFSGKLYTATESAALPLLGQMTTDYDTEVSTGTATVTKGDNTYVISFTVPLTGPVPATVTLNGNPLGSATDCQKLLILPTGQKVPYAGAYTAILEPATPAGATVPAGAGWATVNISTAAVVTFTGALGDGTKFTAAVSPSAGPSYRLFVQPYTAARAQSYLAGTFTLLPHPILTSLRQVPTADLTWKKAGLPADASYRAGFSPVTTVLTIDPWIKPATATPLKTLLGLPGTSFNVSASLTGLTSDADMPTAVSLSSANAVTVTAPSSNLTKWKTTLTAATGAFTGSFEVPSGAKKVTVSFSGVLRQPPSNTTSATDPVIGDGAFILPGATATSEKQTGEVLFQRP